MGKMKKAKPSEVPLEVFAVDKVLNQLISWAEKQGFEFTLVTCFYCKGKGEVYAEYYKEMRQCSWCWGGGYVPE